MDEQRFVVADRVGQRLEPHLPVKVKYSGATATNNRLLLEAVFWRARTGSPWRGLPAAFVNWNTVFRSFRRWFERGVFESLFYAISDDSELEYAPIDGTIVSVHQKATGVRGGLKLKRSGARAAG